jgi:hypothetical protein
VLIVSPAVQMPYSPEMLSEVQPVKVSRSQLSSWESSVLAKLRVKTAGIVRLEKLSDPVLPLSLSKSKSFFEAEHPDVT